MKRYERDRNLWIQLVEPCWYSWWCKGYVPRGVWDQEDKISVGAGECTYVTLLLAGPTTIHTIMRWVCVLIVKWSLQYTPPHGHRINTVTHSSPIVTLTGSASHNRTNDNLCQFLSSSEALSLQCYDSTAYLVGTASLHYFGASCSNKPVNLGRSSHDNNERMSDTTVLATRALRLVTTYTSKGRPANRSPLVG